MWIIRWIRKKRVAYSQQVLNEIENVCEMLQQQGESDSKSRYLEIVAVLALAISDSLDIIQTLLAIGLGLLVVLIIK